VITFEDAKKKTHFFISQITTDDKLYVIASFSSFIKAAYAFYLMNEEAGNTLRTDGNNNNGQTIMSEQEAKEQLIEKICDNLNKEEGEMNNKVVDIVVNTNFEDSFVVFNTD